MIHRMKKDFCDQMMSPLYVKVVFTYIYIFIEYLKCVWKSNCIRIIRNDSKKERRARAASPGLGSASRSGKVRLGGAGRQRTSNCGARKCDTDEV